LVFGLPILRIFSSYLIFKTMTADLSVYFKSLIAGALAALASAAVVFVVAIITLIIMSRRTEDGASYGWDPISFAHTPLAWSILALAFLAGFYWKYHRIASH
jgi:hypothetical protein